MLIGEVAKKYGVSVDTLRYYEKIHLLIPRRNRKGRFYTERELVKLEQI
ncbi:MerR family transcriptional regulator, partial [Anaerobranca gottschalkii]